MGEGEGVKRRTHGITTELCTDPTPTPRRRLSNVSEDLSTLLRRFGASRVGEERRGLAAGGSFVEYSAARRNANGGAET